MPYIKKLIFAVPYFLSMVAFYLQADQIIKDPTILFSFDLNLLLKLIYFAVSMCAVAYFFIIFGAFASDWKIVAPTAALGSAAAAYFIQPPVGLYFAVALFIAFCASFAMLLNKLTKDPTSFHTSDHIIKPAGQLTTFIVLITSALIYISTQQSSQQMISKMIDSVVNLSSEFVNTQQQLTEAPGTAPSAPALTADQLNLLRQNPALLKQYGLDPSVLNQFDTTQKAATPQNIAVAAAKPLIKNQITNFIQPYMPFVPFLIAFLFYLNFQFFTSIISLLFSPLTHLLFYILEKTNFIRFEKSTREVKKLAI